MVCLIEHQKILHRSETLDSSRLIQKRLKSTWIVYEPSAQLTNIHFTNLMHHVRMFLFVCLFFKQICCKMVQ